MIISRLKSLLQKIPVDLGQGSFHHKTKGKRIALALIPTPNNSGNSRNFTALDIGCDDGYYSRILQKMGYEVTSTDVVKNYEFSHLVDANKVLPYPDNYFDVVWSSEVIEHLEDPVFTLKEVRRVLHLDGTAIFTTPNSQFWIYPILRVFFGITPAQAQNQPHLHFFGIENIKRFNPERIYGFFPYLILKFRITKLLNLLTPTFIFVIKKNLR